MLTTFDKYDKIDESWFFNNERMVIDFLYDHREVSEPKFHIGDIVYSIDKNLTIYENTPYCEYSEETVKMVKEYSNGNQLKVVSKFKGQVQSEYPWWSEVIIIGEEKKDKYWIIDKCLSDRYEPSYKPKEKPNRILEEYGRYPFNCVIVTFDNIEDVIEFEKYQPAEKYGGFTDVFLDNVVHDLDKEPIYIVYALWDDEFKWDGWCGLHYLDTHTKGSQLEYEKLYTFKDVKNGLFDKIKRYGHYQESPIYKPREKNVRILEEYSKYPYNSIIIVVNNEEEAIEFMKLEDITHIGLTDSFENAILGMISRESAYFKFLVKPFEIEFDGWGELSYLPESDRYRSTTHEKPFSVKDLKNDLFDKILKFGKYKLLPNYKPKGKSERTFEHLNENYVDLKSKNELDNFVEREKIDYPLFNFGDIISLKSDILELYDKVGMVSTKYKDWLIENIDKNLIINEVSYDTDRKTWYYKVNDFYWVMEIFIDKSKPVYKPKEKSERTFESKNDVNDAYEIFVKIKSDEELTTLRNLLISLDYSIPTFLYHVDYFLPMYVFINLEEGGRISKMSKSAYDRNLSYGDLRDNYIFEGVWLNILTMDDLPLITRILTYKTINFVPDYKPKNKIERTFESFSNNYQYRFKTMDEFIKEYGEYWFDELRDYNPDKRIGASWSERMDYLLGKPCELDDIDMSLNLRYYLPATNIDRGYWIITNEMLTRNEKFGPNYKPKIKFKRTFESFNDDNDNNDLNYVIKKLNGGPYDVIIYRHHNNLDFYNKLMEVFKKYPYFNTGHIDKNFDDMYGVDLFFTLKDVDNWKQFNVYISNHEDTNQRNYITEYPNIVFCDGKVDSPFKLDKMLNDIIGQNKPIYIPKGKSERTLESNKWYPYRFKTEDEFHKEFGYGEDWRYKVPGYFSLLMDYLCGKVYPFDKLLNGEEQRIYDDWGITKSMLTPNQKSPNYESKIKSIRTLESNQWYPYRFKTKEEFIKEYGEHWRNANGDSDCGFVIKMDYLLGQVYPHFPEYTLDEITNDDENDVLDGMECDDSLVNRGYWIVKKFMLTPNERPTPTYNAKKKIDRIL